MSGANPTVKVVFAADSAQLEAANKRVIASADSVSHHLKDTATQAKYMKTSLTGAATAAQLFGGEMGQTAVNAGYALVAVKDLTKGVGGLVKGMSGAKLATGGFIAAIAAAGVAVSAHIDHTSALNEVERTGADVAYYGAAALSTLTAKVPVLGGWFDKLRDKTDYLSQSLHNMGQAAYDASLQAAQAALVANGLGVGAEEGSEWDPSVSLAPGTAAYQRLQASADSIKTLKAPKASGGGGGSAGSSIKSMANDVAQAAKEAAQKLKQARASVASAVGSIVQALAGHLEAGDPGQSLMVGGKLLSASKGTSLIDKLRKQADDTKHLATDLKKLAKMGLSKGLLSDLVAGGLDSLPAADELLRGGKSTISTANSLNASITASGTSIASAEVTRNLTKKDLGTIKVDLTGAESDVKKMFRKWLRTDGANSFGLAAA